MDKILYSRGDTMSNIQFSAPTPHFIGWYELDKEEKAEVNEALRNTLKRELAKRGKIKK